MTTPTPGSRRQTWRLEIEVGGVPRGLAVLVDTDLAITCAHLFDNDPSATFAVRTPNGARVAAHIIEGGWFPAGEGGAGDIAVIRLDDDSDPEIGPARVSRVVNVGQRFRVQGVLRGGTGSGPWAEGRILGPGGPRGEWFQLEGARLERGSSGAGVIGMGDEVLGIVVSTEARTGATWMIPFRTIAEYWPAIHRVPRLQPQTVRPPQPVRPQGSLVHPGIAADTIEGIDMLGRSADAEAMGALLAASSTAPPLSVGLFGDWGSGKSFFMRMLRTEIDSLANLSRLARKSGQPTVMCGEVRQIVFNAWHYTDANLWASLVSAIFTGLARPTSGESVSDAEQRWVVERERLATVLESTKAQLAEARSKSDAADADVERLREELASLEDKKAEERKSLTGLRPAAQAAWADEAVKAKVQKVREHFAGEIELGQIREFTDAGLTGWRRAGRIWQLMRASQRRRLVWWLAIATVLGVAAFVAIPLVFKDSLPVLSQVFGSLVALAAPIAVAGARIAGRINQGLGVVESAVAAAAAAERAEQERLENQKQAILAEIAQLDARQTMLRKEMLHAEARVNAAATEVDEASTGRLLATFISERSASNDYRSQLGMIATIRRDFEQLAGLMELPAEGDDAVPPIERIVLYIDDLDRCPPDRVVEVLQAIHLLLGLELFVVVVAVDSRWLLSSLELHFEKVLGARQAGGGQWSATPMSYLEKIFQIPFNLSAMDEPAYAQLVESLLDEAVAGPGTGGQGVTGRGREQGAAKTGVSAASGTTGEGVTLDLKRLNPAGLILSDDEKAFARKLAPLIGTPRSAKRLANLYRLIRAGLSESALAEMLQTGGYEAILLLLAVLVGKPSSAATLFDALYWAEDSEPLSEIVQRRVAWLAEVQPHIRQLKTAGEFKPWIPVVSRYSFQLKP